MGNGEGGGTRTVVDRTQGSAGASGRAQDIPRLSLSHSGLLLTGFFWTKLCSFKRESEGCDM